ncbi:MAG: nickel/cobalt efflux transporter [Stenotrophobium sp.]
MTSFNELLQQGSAHAWLFVPSAILLGALHGLEPGHSKTMMAAFIIAVRGTVAQAALLGLSATLSHTAVVWAIALIGLRYGSRIYSESTEGFFQLVSAALIIGIALWMLVRTYREQQREKAQENDDHGHSHDESKKIATRYGTALLEIFEANVPPRFRLRFETRGGEEVLSAHAYITIETIRPDGVHQLLSFIANRDFLESAEEIPEPHAFRATLRIMDQGHAYVYDVEFSEHSQGHDHAGLDISAPGFQDAHELAHASDIKRRFADRNITTWQIVMFGLTGGLIPCPASITILLLCLQLKQYSLGLTLVLCFSIGLALTMVTTGAIAALSVREASRRFSGFGTLARRAPYVSCALITAIGLYTGYIGYSALTG